LSEVPGEGGVAVPPAPGLSHSRYTHARSATSEAPRAGQVATMGTDHTTTSSVFDARLRDLQARADQATSERRRAERDLRERDVRLAVNSDIARAMRDGEPPGRIVQRVVDSLHTHFPHFRSAYSTISADGLVAVACSAGAAEETWSDATPAVLSSDTLGTLAEVDLIANGATGDGTTGAELPAALAAGDVPAVLQVLQAPVRHATTLAGVLGSMPPHA